MNNQKFQVLWIRHTHDFKKVTETQYTTLERQINGTDNFPYKEVNILAVRMFTGMKTDDGIEIYQGDIFADDMSDGSFRHGVVRYDETQAKFVVLDDEGENVGDLDEWDSCFLVGNEFENPHLLPELLNTKSVR